MKSIVMIYIINLTFLGNCPILLIVKKKITKSIIWWLLFPQMQAFKDTGKAPVETEVAIHRIRITLTSRNVKSLEKGELAQCC